MSQGAFSTGQFVWWIGTVEDRNDPEKLGRVKVRIQGYHSDDTTQVNKDSLPWATIAQPTTSAFYSGVGCSPTWLVEGCTVFGFFMDGHNAQAPVVLATLGGKVAKPKENRMTNPNDPNANKNQSATPYYDENESDTNRMARGDKLENTVVQWRKDNIDEASGANR